MDQAAHQRTIALLLRTGQEVLRIRREGLLNARMKSDADYDVLTDADIAASKLLTEGLADIFPGMRLISEEDEENCPTSEYKTAIVIDPIDGTRNFRDGKPGFSVLIGMVENNMPVHGFAYFPDPHFSALFYTDPSENKAFSQSVRADDAGVISLGEKTELSFRRSSARAPRVIESYTDVSDYFPGPYEVVKYRAPSSAFAMLSGEAEVAAGPPTMKDWDLAAQDAIARRIGAVYVDIETGEPLRYGERRGEGREYMQPRYVGGYRQTLQALGLMKGADRKQAEPAPTI